jgi:hypothetical protein
MLRLSVSDEHLLSLAIPGATLFLALAILFFPLYEVAGSSILASIDEHINGDHGTSWVVVIAASVAVALMIIYVLSAFLGAILRTVIGTIEYQIIDRIQACRLRLSRDEYNTQWDRYLDHLEDHRNSYISQLVDAYHFEARSALSLLILAIALFVRIDSWWAALIFLVSALFLGWSAYTVHLWLAKNRKRKFST